MNALRRMMTAAAVAAAMMTCAAVQAADPVIITYGYHPYWTGGWSGVIIKSKELWKKYLPEGSQVHFEAHLTGPPMVNALLADKMQIGTMGDMPSLVATTRRDIGDVRLASVVMFSAGQQCNKLLVARDAPEFASVEEAAAWISEGPIAVHRGTCANRFVESLIEKQVLAPTEVLNMSIEVIASNFEAGQLRAAAMWEPHARRVVEAGYAKYAATGAPWGENDASFTLMRQDFIENNPEAAVGWVKAEIEALRFIAENPAETAAILEAELTGYDAMTAWAAIYEKNPEAIGGAETNYVAAVLFDEAVLELMREGYAFLHRIQVVPSPEMPENAYNDGPVRQALEELGLTAPVGVIIGIDRAEAPFQ